MSDARLRDLERKWIATGSPEDLAGLDAERFRMGDIQHVSRDVILRLLQRAAPEDWLHTLARLPAESFPYRDSICWRSHANTLLRKLLLSQEDHPIAFSSKKELLSVPQDERELIRSLEITANSPDLKVLQKFTHVRSLKFFPKKSREDMDGTLESLVGFMNELEALRVPRRNITHEGFAHIAKFQNLRSLEISVSIAGLPPAIIHHLGIMRGDVLSHISATAITSILKLKNLEHLSLSGCEIPEDGVLRLLICRSPKLKRLNLSGTGISKSQIDALGLKLSNLEIQF